MIKNNSNNNDNNHNSKHTNNNKVILAIGQDLFSIQEYITEQYNYTLHQYITKHNHTTTHNGSTSLSKSKLPSPPTYTSTIPSIVMFYTDIQTLNGLYTPVDYGSGIEYTNGLLDTFLLQNFDSRNNKNNNKLSIQIGLWLNGTIGCTTIISKQLDNNLHTLFTYLQNEQRINTIYLRLGYEFDNPSFGYSTNPTLYKYTFQYIVNYYTTRFHNTGTTTTKRHKQQSQNNNNNNNNKKKKIQFVWHSWGQGQLPINTTLDDFYPGYQYVDWIGISVFTQVYKHSFSGTLQDIQNVINFAHGNNHTNIMIAESTPFGGIVNVNSMSTSSTAKQQNDHEHDHETVIFDPWNNWFVPVLQLIHNTSNNIKMWSYINCNWDTQPMWYNVGFGDTRISSNTTIQYLWNQHIIQNTNLFIVHTSSNEQNDENDDDDDTIKSTPVKNMKDRINNIQHSQTSLIQLPLLTTDRQQQQHDQQRINNNNNNITTGSSHIPFVVLFIIVGAIVAGLLLVVVDVSSSAINRKLKKNDKQQFLLRLFYDSNKKRRNDNNNNDNDSTVVVIATENSNLIG